jgi:hypothetical protein
MDDDRRGDSTGIPMSNDQIIAFDTVRMSMARGGSGFAGLWAVTLLFLVPAIVFESVVLFVIAAIIGVPTAVASVRRARARRMWR